VKTQNDLVDEVIRRERNVENLVRAIQVLKRLRNHPATPASKRAEYIGRIEAIQQERIRQKRLADEARQEYISFRVDVPEMLTVPS